MPRRKTAKRGSSSKLRLSPASLRLSPRKTPGKSPRREMTVAEVTKLWKKEQEETQKKLQRMYDKNKRNEKELKSQIKQWRDLSMDYQKTSERFVAQLEDKMKKKLESADKKHKKLQNEMETIINRMQREINQLKQSKSPRKDTLMDLSNDSEEIKRILKESQKVREEVTRKTGINMELSEQQKKFVEYEASKRRVSQALGRTASKISEETECLVNDLCAHRNTSISSI